MVLPAGYRNIYPGRYFPRNQWPGCRAAAAWQARVAVPGALTGMAISL